MNLIKLKQLFTDDITVEIATNKKIKKTIISFGIIQKGKIKYEKKTKSNRSNIHNCFFSNNIIFECL